MTMRNLLFLIGFDEDNIAIPSFIMRDGDKALMAAF
jgi:hypothetical protein